MIQFASTYESVRKTDPVWQDIRNLIETAARQVSLGKIIVINEIPAGSEVFADPLIVKVFYNLVDNATRYGGKITTIRFSLAEHDGKEMILCEDDGAGIPRENKKKIFDRGFGKNTGLGLFLAREILSLTGITIRETGEPGAGARFEMAVPKGSYRFTGK
jgi:signal transduction histidine kinase